MSSSSKPSSAARKLLLLFPGRDGFLPGTGRIFYEREPVFRDMVRRCSAIIGDDKWLKNYFESEIKQTNSSTDLQFSTLVNAVIHLGISQLWLSKGLVPDGTIGCSLGEVTASYINRSLSMDEVVRFARFVDSGHERIEDKAKYIMVHHAAGDFHQLICDSPVSLGLCVEWGPSLCILTCAIEDVNLAAQFLENRTLYYEVCIGEYAYHTSLLAEWRESLRAELGSMDPHMPICEVYSSFVGTRVAEGVSFDTNYWFWEASKPVRFKNAIMSALEDGYNTILCMASSHIVGPPVLEMVARAGVELTFLDSINYSEPENITFGKTCDALRELKLLKGDGQLWNLGYIGAHAEVPAGENLLHPGAPRSATVHRSRYQELLPDQSAVRFAEARNCYSLFGYDEVSISLRQFDQYFSRALTDGKSSLSEEEWTLYDLVRQQLLPRFSARAVQEVEGYIELSARKLLQEAQLMEEGGHIDHFAIPLSEIVLGRLIGLSLESIQSLQVKMRAVSERGMERSQFEELISEVGELVYSELGNLPYLVPAFMTRGAAESEIARVLGLIWDEGRLMLGETIRAAGEILLDHLAVRCEVQRDADLLVPFIEEVLRFDCPRQVMVCKALRKVEFGEICIPEGAEVELCLGAANRDPRRYSKPNLFQLERNPRDHLAFGAGKNYFWGATLARKQALIAIKTLMEMSPDLQTVVKRKSRYLIPETMFKL